MFNLVQALIDAVLEFIENSILAEVWKISVIHRSLITATSCDIHSVKPHGNGQYLIEYSRPKGTSEMRGIEKRINDVLGGVGYQVQSCKRLTTQPGRQWLALSLAA